MSQQTQESVLSIEKAIQSRSDCWIQAVIHKKTDQIWNKTKDKYRYEYLFVDETGKEILCIGIL